MLLIDPETFRVFDEHTSATGTYVSVLDNNMLVHQELKFLALDSLDGGELVKFSPCEETFTLDKIQIFKSTILVTWRRDDEALTYLIMIDPKSGQEGDLLALGGTALDQLITSMRRLSTNPLVRPRESGEENPIKRRKAQEPWRSRIRGRPDDNTSEQEFRATRRRFTEPGEED